MGVIPHTVTFWSPWPGKIVPPPAVHCARDSADGRWGRLMRWQMRWHIARNPAYYPPGSLAVSDLSLEASGTLLPGYSIYCDQPRANRERVAPGKKRAVGSRYV